MSRRFRVKCITFFCFTSEKVSCSKEFEIEDIPTVNIEQSALFWVWSPTTEIANKKIYFVFKSISF